MAKRGEAGMLVNGVEFFLLQKLISLRQRSWRCHFNRTFLPQPPLYINYSFCKYMGEIYVLMDQPSKSKRGRNYLPYQREDSTIVVRFWDSILLLLSNCFLSKNINIYRTLNTLILSVVLVLGVKLGFSL